MRRTTALIGALASIALALAVAAPASADPGGRGGDPPGSNGTIRIHAAGEKQKVFWVECAASASLMPTAGAAAAPAPTS